MMNKRILVLSVELSGINKYLFSFLQNKGWDMLFVKVPFPRLCKIWAILSTFRPGVRLWKKKCNEKLEKLHKTPWAFRQRTKYCNKEIKKFGNQYDIILQISGMFSPYLDYKKENKPYVTFNDYTMALSKKYEPWSPFASVFKKWQEVEKRLYENAEYIFTPSENTRKSMINDYGIAEDKVIKTGYGLTLERILNIAKVYDGKTILFIGMDFERKGGKILLEAFKKVRKAASDARLIIVGPNKDVFALSQPGVEWMGCIRDNQQIEELYREASIFVMPSLCEPFGLVFLEAMAHKLPCVGTSIDAIGEIIEDGKTGFLAPPNNADALAEKIIKLMDNSDLMKQFGMAGYERVRKEFQWDGVIEKIDIEIHRYLLRQDNA